MDTIDTNRPIAVLPASRTLADLLDAWADGYVDLAESLREQAAELREADEAAQLVAAIPAVVALPATLG